MSEHPPEAERIRGQHRRAILRATVSMVFLSLMAYLLYAFNMLSIGLALVPLWVNIMNGR